MKKLLNTIKRLRDSNIKSIIDQRLGQFLEVGESSSEEIFIELCFCILTANCSAERCMEVQLSVGKGFSTLSAQKLTNRLRKLGYRYPNVRSKYIVEARIYKDTIKDVIGAFDNSVDARAWLVKNIKGMGHKEASHFLRNIGFTDLAIIDFHIIDVLIRYGIIKRPKTLTRKRYFEIEDQLKMIARKSDLNLAELDLHLWYIETGKILK
ncbi:MAG: N-glycosylase/DNA lyase [Candidatus Bathyarchaeota archaeon]